MEHGIPSNADIETSKPYRPLPSQVALSVDPEWARLLTRLQQLKASGASVIIDLEKMTIRVCGKSERLQSN